MTSHRKNGYYSIPGSADLLTRSRDEVEEIRELESIDRAEHSGRIIAGQVLTRTVVRSGYTPVLDEVFDRLCPKMSALEQVVYMHLYSLALRRERNHCRATRAELMRRSNLSDRRLGKALAGLATAGLIRPVHRDRRGTLYRVLLPHEFFSEGDRNLVMMAPARDATPNARNNRVLKSQSFKDEVKKEEVKTLGSVAATFMKKRTEYARADVVDEIVEALAAGRSLEEIATRLDGFARRSGVPALDTLFE